MANLPPGFTPLPGPFKVSPLYDSDKLQGNRIEDKIDVLQDWIEGWVFDCAQALLDHPKVHGHFAAISLTLSYFEGHQVWRIGTESRGKSKAFFRDTFKTVFSPATPSASQLAQGWAQPNLEEVADRMYELARCGFAHLGLPKEGVVWAKTGVAISTTTLLQGNKIVTLIIDPWEFLDAARAHFDAYIDEVKKPTSTVLRANFEKAWGLLISGSPILFPPGFTSKQPPQKHEFKRQSRRKESHGRSAKRK